MAEEQQQQGGQGQLQQQLQQRQEHQQGQRDHRNYHQTMKKIIFYEFMPSKMREDYLSMNNTRQKRKCLKEMTDMDPPPQTDPANPWRIRKTLTAMEVTMKMIIVSEQEAVDHIFRYWSLEMANHAFLGTDAFRELVIWDVTALPVGEPVRVCSASTFFQNDPGSRNYSLGLGDLVESRGLGPRMRLACTGNQGNLLSFSGCCVATIQQHRFCYMVLYTFDLALNALQRRNAWL